jgi:hypothetical protein
MHVIPLLHTLFLPKCELLPADTLPIIAFLLFLGSVGNDSGGNDSGRTDVATPFNLPVYSGQRKDGW